jgi:type I restriction enzyme S subunit
MNIANEDCCIGRGLAALNSKEDCISYLDGVLQYMKQIFDRRNTDGTTFGSITKGDLFSLAVVKPNNDVLLSYDKIVKPMFKKQNTIGLENQKLSELRDWLLPMLMNGQITVGDAEKEMESLGLVAEGDAKYGEE